MSVRAPVEWIRAATALMAAARTARRMLATERDIVIRSHVMPNGLVDAEASVLVNEFHAAITALDDAIAHPGWSHA